MKTSRHIITPELSYGCGMTCSHAHDNKRAIIHACKEPCHRQALAYKEKSLLSSHPHYLACEKQGHLYLNLIDPPAPLFQIESFRLFLDFADRMRAQGRSVHIHCNQGQSRAPSLTLLYMAKRLGLLPVTSYAAARRAFEAQYPYLPGKGIETFLSANWDNLG